MKPILTRVSRLFAIVGAFLAFASIQAFAQEATIVGTVTDPSGAVIVNAKITATNADDREHRNPDRRHHLLDQLP